MECWRRVEVAACEELPGLLGATTGRARPSSRRSAARRSPSRRCASASASPSTTSRRSSTCSRASAGEAGRWIHFGLTSSDVLDTALALQLRAAGEVIVRRRARARRGARRARARARAHAVRRAHARRARRADDLRREARGLRLRGAPQRRRLERAFAQVAVGAISGAVGHLLGDRPGVRGARARAAGARARARLDAGRPARPPRRAARRDRARRRRPRAPRDRGPPPAAHRGARGSQEPFRAGAEGLDARCRTSATRSARADLRASRACCAATRRRRSRTSRCGTSATSRTPRVERVILPDSTILLDYLQHRAIALVEGLVDRRRADAREPRADARRALLPARAARARRGRACARDEAYRIVQELAQRAWDEGIPLRELLAGRRARAQAELRPRRDLRLRALHALRRGDRRRGWTRSPERRCAQRAAHDDAHVTSSPICR